jgi:hypothetical protein
VLRWLQPGQRRLNTVSPAASANRFPFPPAPSPPPPPAGGPHPCGPRAESADPAAAQAHPGRGGHAGGPGGGAQYLPQPQVGVAARLDGWGGVMGCKCGARGGAVVPVCDHTLGLAVLPGNLAEPPQTGGLQFSCYSSAFSRRDHKQEYALPVHAQPAAPPHPPSLPPACPPARLNAHPPAAPAAMGEASVGSAGVRPCQSLRRRRTPPQWGAWPCVRPASGCTC